MGRWSWPTEHSPPPPPYALPRHAQFFSLPYYHHLFCMLHLHFCDACTYRQGLEQGEQTCSTAFPQMIRKVHFCLFLPLPYPLNPSQASGVVGDGWKGALTHSLSSLSLYDEWWVVTVGEASSAPNQWRGQSLLSETGGRGKGAENSGGSGEGETSSEHPSLRLPASLSPCLPYLEEDRKVAARARRTYCTGLAHCVHFVCGRRTCLPCLLELLYHAAFPLKLPPSTCQTLSYLYLSCMGKIPSLL